MNIIKTSLLVAIILLCLNSCTDKEPAVNSSSKLTIEKTLAVVLPMEQGLEEHWERCLNLYSGNLERAYKNQDVIVKLNYEFYDESSLDLDSLATALGRRDDIYAVVGGLYSSNASILTSHLSRMGKTFFTLATSEELIRAYASTGYLWAMVETDITQCEVLLAKVVNYGGKSVALVAKENDIYGKTFLDWFGFQARELGLENKGVFSYGDISTQDAMKMAVGTQADYVLCVPSEIEEIGEMITCYNSLSESVGAQHSRLLFSDTAYGTDILNYYGNLVEGLEGVAFGADPESGFDVSYRIFYGTNPTTGESQLYDAVMLLGYAAFYQHIQPGETLQSALRKIVGGEYINMGSWTGEDMSLVVDAIASGVYPYVRGASGPLRFDNKVFTNVLSTTYYSYKIYNGKYIILDYNTSEGGNRTDATLAGWNWKVSQMQEFSDDTVVSYPDQTGNWALLVATSTGWTNYRHQADVTAIYRQLRRHGYPDDRIILIVEDDIAYNPLNPNMGVINVVPGGENVYENVVVDYKLSDLKPSDFLSILKGEKSGKLQEVIEAEEGDNIFVYWSGHGVPGELCWHEAPDGINVEMLKETFLEMESKRSYRKLLMMVEACYSGGIFSQCEGVEGMLFITAATGEETSKADFFSGEAGVWISNRFTSTFIEQITENLAVSMRDLYYRMFLNTVGSHVMVYNATMYGNLYSSDMAEFINFKE